MRREVEKKSKRRAFLSGIYKRKATAVEFILDLTARRFRSLRAVKAYYGSLSLRARQRRSGHIYSTVLAR